MPSQLEMVNRTLAELGRPAVQQIAGNANAEYIAAKIAELYPELLLSYTWTFATVYKYDDNPRSVNFSPDFTYTYQLPANFGQFFKWATSGAQYPAYEFVDGLLLAQTRPVQYYYIVNDADYTVFPPLFARAVVLYAASESAPILTNDVQLATYLEKKFLMTLDKAIKQDAMQRSVVQVPYNDFDRILFV